MVKLVECRKCFLYIVLWCVLVVWCDELMSLLVRRRKVIFVVIVIRFLYGLNLVERYLIVIIRLVVIGIVYRRICLIILKIYVFL